MKKYIILLLTGFLLTTCTDMLDQTDPTGPTGDNFFQTENDLQQAVVAAYSGLSLPISLHRLNILGFEQFTDNIYNGSATGDGAFGAWSTFSYDTQNQAIQENYRGFYQLINMCNQVIIRGSEADVSDEVLTQAVAEVTFLRGFAHFMLTLIWGDVPIVTEITNDPSGFAPEVSTANEVYEQVISDLTFAEENLSSVSAQGGRVNSWTAKAMLAKVYLFGADELGNDAWYAMSESKAAEVINSGTFGLFNELSTPKENLESIFQTYNENGKEHIFTVNHYNSGGNWSDNNVASEFPMASTARQMRNNNNMWGYGWAYVYEAIGTQWDDVDARKDYNLWMQDEPIIVNGDTTGYYDQTNQNRCCARANGMCLQKFWYQENSKNVNGRSTLGFPVMRYADLLLMYAEADLLSDGTISAAGVEAVNEVRNRAGLEDLIADEITIEKILEERRWELFGESKRWFDFMRKRNSMPNLFTQAAAAIVAGDTDGDDNDFAAFTPARHWKMPYPQSAVDRNPNLVQKPAWSAGD